MKIEIKTQEEFEKAHTTVIITADDHLELVGISDRLLRSPELCACAEDPIAACTYDIPTDIRLEVLDLQRKIDRISQVVNPGLDLTLNRDSWNQQESNAMARAIRRIRQVLNDSTDLEDFREDDLRT